MKKHKSHARHVFTFLEKNYGVTIVYDDDSSKKGNERKSSGAIPKGKTSDLNEGAVKPRGTNSCMIEKPSTSQVSATTATQSRKSKPSPF
jgi:hypothetical protein